MRSDIAQEMQVALILNHNIPEYKSVISPKFLQIIVMFFLYFINIPFFLSKQVLIYLVFDRFERNERKKKRMDSYIFKINFFLLNINYYSIEKLLNI